MTELDNFKIVADEKCAAMAQKLFAEFISSEVCGVDGCVIGGGVCVGVVEACVGGYVCG